MWKWPFYHIVTFHMQGAPSSLLPALSLTFVSASCCENRRIINYFVFVATIMRKWRWDFQGGDWICNILKGWIDETCLPCFDDILQVGFTEGEYLWCTSLFSPHQNWKGNMIHNAPLLPPKHVVVRFLIKNTQLGRILSCARSSLRSRVKHRTPNGSLPNAKSDFHLVAATAEWLISSCVYLWKKRKLLHARGELCGGALIWGLLLSLTLRVLSWYKRVLWLTTSL